MRTRRLPLAQYRRSFLSARHEKRNPLSCLCPTLYPELRLFVHICSLLLARFPAALTLVRCLLNEEGQKEPNGLIHKCCCTTRGRHGVGLHACLYCQIGCFDLLSSTLSRSTSSLTPFFFRAVLILFHLCFMQLIDIISGCRFLPAAEPPSPLFTATSRRLCRCVG